MTTPAVINTTPTPAWANPLAAGNYRPGKWERRVWMICFWAVFLTAFAQAVFAGLGVWGLAQSRGLAGYSPWTARFAWWFINPWGFVLDCFLGLISAPLALYAFAKARNEGLRCWWPLGIWLAIRIALSVTVVVCATILLLEGSSQTAVVASMVIFRAGLFNLPVWLFLIGLFFVRAERERRRRDPTIDTPAALAPPIDPLA